MKVRAEILSVETHGEKLCVKLQGRQDRDAEWRPYLSLSIEVHDSPRARKAMYLGRVLRLNIETL